VTLLNEVLNEKGLAPIDGGTISATVKWNAMVYWQRNTKFTEKQSLGRVAPFAEYELPSNAIIFSNKPPRPPFEAQK
jgi:hypothetical protein